jgi:hypothetical protein
MGTKPKGEYDALDEKIKNTNNIDDYEMYTEIMKFLIIRRTYIEIDDDGHIVTYERNGQRMNCKFARTDTKFVAIIIMGNISGSIEVPIADYVTKNKTTNKK